MHEPDLQGVIVVAASDVSTETYALNEALQITFDQTDAIPQNELLDAVLALLAPVGGFRFHEERSQTDWGATGPYLQELLVSYSAGAAAGLTVKAIGAGLRKLSRRSAADPASRSGRRVRPVTDAEGAWRLFSKFITRAFKVSSTMAVEVVENESGWWIRAVGDGYRFIGSVAEDGRVQHARRVDEWPSSLEDEE